MELISAYPGCFTAENTQLRTTEQKHTQKDSFTHLFSSKFTKMYSTAGRHGTSCLAGQWWDQDERASVLKTHSHTQREKPPSDGTFSAAKYFSFKAKFSPWKLVHLCGEDFSRCSGNQRESKYTRDRVGSSGCYGTFGLFISQRRNIGFSTWFLWLRTPQLLPMCVNVAVHVWMPYVVWVNSGLRVEVVVAWSIRAFHKLTSPLVSIASLFYFHFYHIMISGWKYIQMRMHLIPSLPRGDNGTFHFVHIVGVIRHWAPCAGPVAAISLHLVVLPFAPEWSRWNLTRVH